VNTNLAKPRRRLILGLPCGAVASTEQVSTATRTAASPSVGPAQVPSSPTTRYARSPAAAEVDQKADKAGFPGIGWTGVERQAFNEGLLKHGKDFARIAEYVRTKTQKQVGF
jgi:hypothetical protein